LAGEVSLWLAREAVPTFRALRLDPDRLEALGRRRLRRLVAAARQCAFWSARLHADGPLLACDGPEPPAWEALRSLPPVTKQELAQAGDAALSGGRARSSWRSSHSSGSTGEPFRMWFDARAWAILKHLVKWRARRACGVGPLDCLAVLDAVPPEAAPSLLGRTGRQRTISVLQPAERIARELVAFRPTVIYALPSALLEVARELGPGTLRPRLVFTSGELLLPGTRASLGVAFGCPVLDVYGSSETKEIAFECLAGSRHLNADVVHVEVIDERGAAVPAGREGQLLITALVNHAMPLLRYRSGDRGSLIAGPCACGLPLPRLGLVSGREVDLIELPGGVRLSPYVLTCGLEQIDGLGRYQIVQAEIDELRVRARAEPWASKNALERSIVEALRQLTRGRARIRVEFADSFPTGPTGKFRVVQALRPTP
jgi:phenylacetate-CoA ligase